MFVSAVKHFLTESEEACVEQQALTVDNGNCIRCHNITVFLQQIRGAEPG
jgi:hypothetical protein